MTHYQSEKKKNQLCLIAFFPPLLKPIYMMIKNIDTITSEELVASS
jgi:hypothetical protein